MKRNKIKPSMEDLVEAFVDEAKGEFSMGDVIQNAAAAMGVKDKSKLKSLDRKVTDFLYEEYPFPELLTREDKSGEVYFVKPWEYFHHGRLCVKPMPFEIENKILFPGHRLMPFHDPDIPPYEARLTFEGKLVPMKDVSMTVKGRFHILFHVRGRRLRFAGPRGLREPGRIE